MRPPSIGGSQELLGTPNMYENLAMEELKYKRDKEEKKKAADKALLDKYRGALNVSGYDPIYNKQITAAASGIIDELNKAQSGKYLNTIESNPGFRQKMADFQVLAGNAKTMTATIAQAQQYAADHPKDVQANKDIFDALNQARVQGDVTPELAKHLGANGMGVDPNKFYSLIPPTPADFSVEVPKVTNPITRKYDSEVDAGDVFKTTGGNVFDKKANLEQAQAIVNTKSSVAGQAALREAGGDPAKAAQLVYNNILYRFDQENKNSIQEKAGGGGLSKNIVKAALDTPTNVVAIPSHKGGAAGLINPVGGIVYGAISAPKQIKPLTPTVQVGSIDTRTGNIVNVPITDPDATLGSPALVPVMKKDGAFGRKGVQLTNRDIAEAKKIGTDLNSLIEWKPMAYMTAKVSTPVIDQATGKQIIDTKMLDDGTVQQVPRTTDTQNQFLVPLDVQKGAYSNTISNINDYEKRAAEMNQDPGKYLNHEAGAGNSTPAASAPEYSKQSLLANGWTEDGINKAVKLGKIKIK